MTYVHSFRLQFPSLGFTASALGFGFGFWNWSWLRLLQSHYVASKKTRNPKKNRLNAKTKTRTGRCIKPKSNYLTKTETDDNQNGNQVLLHWHLQSATIAGCGFDFVLGKKRHVDNAIAVLEPHPTPLDITLGQTFDR